LNEQCFVVVPMLCISLATGFSPWVKMVDFGVGVLTPFLLQAIVAIYSSADGLPPA
jgi:hypothetical protein